jgi:hypothetical protein
MSRRRARRRRPGKTRVTESADSRRARTSAVLATARGRVVGSRTQAATRDRLRSGRRQAVRLTMALTAG